MCPHVLIFARFQSLCVACVSEPQQTREFIYKGNPEAPILSSQFLTLFMKSSLSLIFKLPAILSPRFSIIPTTAISATMSTSDHSSPAFDRPRSVIKKVLAKLQHEGDGAVVRRGIGRSLSFFFVFYFFYFFLFYFITGSSSSSPLLILFLVSVFSGAI